MEAPADDLPSLKPALRFSILPLLLTAATDMGALAFLFLAATGGRTGSTISSITTEE
jgi:hypothetical protein